MQSVEVHALGSSGAGKTVFMASLYRYLSLQRPHLAFYVKSDHESSLYLNTVYNRVANPDEDWPEASQSVHEWNFTACVSGQTGDFEPLEFRYLDYPGGFLTSRRGDEDEAVGALLERLRAANSLLVLLDGQAVRALIRKEPGSERFLEQEIVHSLEVAQRSRCPLHFAVTKWDLLQGDHTLGEARDALLADENFCDFVTAKSQQLRATIRMYPVSAVGPGFAELQPNGQMKKLGGRPRPEGVELPLLSVLPDFFAFVYEEVIARDTGATLPKGPTLAEKVSRGVSNPAWQARFRQLATMAMPALKRAVATYDPRLKSVVSLNTDGLVDSVVSFVERMTASRAERARIGLAAQADELQNVRRQLTGEREALELLERQCELQVSSFEDDHPESVLAGGLFRLVAALDPGAPGGTGRS